MGNCMTMNTDSTHSSDGDVPSGGNSPPDTSFFLVRQYKGFLPGDRVNSYDPDDLSDVSVPSDDEGRDKILADVSPASVYERNQRNIEISIAIEDWSDYQDFARKITIDERVRKMKADRVQQLRQRAYMASQTEEEKTDFWRLHYQTVLEQGLRELASRKKNL